MTIIGNYAIRYVRTNAVYDIYLITGCGLHEYVYELRNTGITEEQILEAYTQ
jgi:hypothetical protein